MTTVLNVGTYMLLSQYIGIDAAISNIIAWIVAVAFAYITNRLWVFESKASEFKEILRELVAINTVADKDNNLIMNYIGNYFLKLGFNIERTKNRDTGKEVLIAKYGQDPAIGFLGHTDTVGITDGWDTDPFTLTEKNEKLYGARFIQRNAR